MKKLIERIKEIFQEKLKAKTNWGRNDVMIQYNSAVQEALLELLD